MNDTERESGARAGDVSGGADDASAAAGSAEGRAIIDAHGGAGAGPTASAPAPDPEATDSDPETSRSAE